MWTAETRSRYTREGLRYPSDVTDAEWDLVHPFLVSSKHQGSPSPERVRALLNGVLYVLSTGCQWRALPKDLPPRSTVHGWFVRWHCDGVLDRLHFALYQQAREIAGKEASPTAAIVDRKTRQEPGKGGRHPDPVGYDAGKKVKGKKRHVIVDTLGLMLGLAVTPADVQDRDGFLPLLKQVRRLFVFLKRLFADGSYSGVETMAAVKRVGKMGLEIVRRSDHAKGFVVLPKRWIVERTFGWLGRCRRLTKDFEHLTRTQIAFVQLAMIRLMMRRIARAPNSS